MTLFPDQAHALEVATRSRAAIVTGSAGTGKSTAVRAILEELVKSGEPFELAAPSGKAAKRLSEVTGYPAKTIHKLLEPIHEQGRFRFKRNATNPIAAQLVVLDEVSMVDTSLFARTLEALEPETRLLLVGDPYQLPSVGPGNVLRDLLVSKAIPSAELTIVKRQDEGLLIRNCQNIRQGLDIEVDNARTTDFLFIPLETEAEIKAKIVDLVSRSLPAERQFDSLQDIQVISPFRERTELSCLGLNQALQGALNKSPVIDHCKFRVGDKVIQLKNDYERDIVNGDIGYVREIDIAGKKIVIAFESPERLVDLPLRDNDLDLAYSLTVHKSQGSEWPAVILPIHASFGPLLLHRNLLYTAVSRAKKLCVMVGQRDQIPKIVRRTGQEKRFTGLAKLLTHGEARDTA